MIDCIDAIDREEVKALVFSSLSGVIGKGVYDEVNKAIKLGKPVYYLYNNTLSLYCPNFEIINESRRIYALVK